MISLSITVAVRRAPQPARCRTPCGLRIGVCADLQQWYACVGRAHDQLGCLRAKHSAATAGMTPTSTSTTERLPFPWCRWASVLRISYTTRVKQWLLSLHAKPIEDTSDIALHTSLLFEQSLCAAQPNTGLRLLYHD